MNELRRHHASPVAAKPSLRVLVLIVGLTLAACNSAAGEAGTTAASPTARSSAPSTTSPEDAELPTLPRPGFAFDVGSEIRVASDVTKLAAGSEFLFAISPPDTLLRIEPVLGDVTSLDLQIGPTIGGASWTVAGDTIWLVGGAFRDQLIEIDTTTMTEVGRTDLGDDHAVAAATADEVWLTTLRAVRRFDIATGALDPPIGFDVDTEHLTIDTDGDIWVSLPTAAQVARIDPTTNRVDTFDVAPGPGWMNADHGVVWVSHTPIASVSRLDRVTGETIEVIDLDLSHGTVASAQTGALQATIDGVWVYVSFPGSRFRDALALIDPTGAVVGARMIPFDSHTWEAVDGGIWLHRLAAGTVIRSTVDDLVDASPTDVIQLLPATSSPSTTATGTSVVTDDEAELLAQLDRVLDPATPAADLGIEDQSDVRNALIELASAQAELHVEPLSVTIDDPSATTVFDVLVEGETVILPAVELGWHRADNERIWHLDATTFCRLAIGVGITGCIP